MAKTVKVRGYMRSPPGGGRSAAGRSNGGRRLRRKGNGGRRKGVYSNPAASKFHTSVRMGSGNWISRGTFNSRAEAVASAKDYKKRAGKSGHARVSDSIGNTVYSA